MKIAITKEMKRVLTVAEMPEVRRVIEGMKEDTGIKDYAEMAARVASGSRVKSVMEASAGIAKNCRVRDAYHPGSGDLDVWLEVIAYTEDGFVMVGAYLTDIWQITGDNNDSIKRHMFIRLFREVK